MLLLNISNMRTKDQSYDLFIRNDFCLWFDSKSKKSKYNNVFSIFKSVDIKFVRNFKVEKSHAFSLITKAIYQIRKNGNICVNRWTKNGQISAIWTQILSIYLWHLFDYIFSHLIMLFCLINNFNSYRLWKMAYFVIQSGWTTNLNIFLEYFVLSINAWIYCSLF